jgi:hypothetical protein
MKKLLLPAVAALALTLGLPACQKNDDAKPGTTDLVAVDDQQQTADAEEEAATLFDDSPTDFFLMTAAPTDGNGLTNARLGGDFCGATVSSTKDANGNRKTVIDFGTGKTCANGVTRKGVLVIERVPGTGKDFSQTITYQDGYAVNDRQMTGTVTVTQAIDGNGLGVRTKIKDLNIVRDGRTITFTSNKTRTYDRKGTLSPADDEIRITGSSSATASDGTGFSAVIGTPILYKNACGLTNRVPVAGIVDITPIGKSLRVVDYGDGTCDRQYTVTVDGQTVTKTFK